MNIQNLFRKIKEVKRERHAKRKEAQELDCHSATTVTKTPRQPVMSSKHFFVQRSVTKKQLI